MTSEICFGFWGESLIFVTRERLDSYRVYIETLSALNKARTWELVLADTNRESLEQDWSNELDVWWQQEHPDAEREREAYELPGPDHVSIHSLFEHDCIDLLDDSAADPGLPAQIIALARYPETSPMTGYDPYEWDPSAVALAELITQQLNLKLCDESDLISTLHDSIW